MRQTKYTVEVIEFLKDNYPEKGKNYCKEFLGSDFTACGIEQFCNLRGIYRDPNFKKINNNFNIDDFKNPSTPNIAYYLGLLWADGHVTKYSARLQNKVDDSLLFFEYFKCLGKFNTGIYKNGEHLSSLIIMQHAVICKFLLEMDYGIKSSASPSKILNIIPKEFHHLFWLGFFDGDGNCYYDEKKLSANVVSFSGSYDQDWTDLNIFLNNYNLEPHLVKTIDKKRGHKCSVIKLWKVFNIAKLGDILYRDYEENGIGLDRKRQKFLKIKERSQAMKKSFLGLRGVRLHTKDLYRIDIYYKEFRYIAYFKNKNEAALLYDIKAVEFHGEKAKTNFPIGNYTDEFMSSEKANTLRASITSFPHKKKH